jgi:hypothetical protein
MNYSSGFSRTSKICCRCSPIWILSSRELTWCTHSCFSRLTTFDGKPGYTPAFSCRYRIRASANYLASFVAGHAAPHDRVVRNQSEWGFAESPTYNKVIKNRSRITVTACLRDKTAKGYSTQSPSSLEGRRSSYGAEANCSRRRRICWSELCSAACGP